MALDNHLYVGGNIIKYPEGDISLQRRKVPYSISQDDQFHTVVDGENLTDIAFRYYGDPIQWFNIADVNNIFNPFDLVVGSNLVIPTLENLDIDAI